MPGFALVWDLGIDKTISEIRISSATSAPQFIYAFLLQRSSDGVTWTDDSDTKGIVYPGNNSTYVGVVTAGIYWRYVRLNCTDPQSPGAYFRVGEIEMRTDVASANLCTGGTAFASQQYYPASRAFDGLLVSNVNDWAANPSASQTIGYDFGVTKTVNYVTVINSTTAVSGEMDQGLKGFSIEVSNDNVIWRAAAFTASHPRGSGLSVQYLLSTMGTISGGIATYRINVSTVPADLAISHYNPPGAVKTISHTKSSTLRREGFGLYQIVGTVKEQSTPANVPLKRRVRLTNERDGALLQETWSDPVTGAYTFTYIPGDLAYTVVSYDYLHNYRAVIADNLTAEKMP
jgi:hypothetical protein